MFLLSAGGTTDLRPVSLSLAQVRIWNRKMQEEVIENSFVKKMKKKTLLSETTTLIQMLHQIKWKFKKLLGYKKRVKVEGGGE